MTAVSAEEPTINEDEEIRKLLEQAKLTIEGPLPATNITKLDLPNCNLSSLPSGFADALPNLSILFLSKNCFREMPAVIGQCPNLQMVAFKDNGMESIHPDALQPQLRWLILTDNQLSMLPDSIGQCTKLQKLMLSGNRIEELPESISKCTQLELVRLASNQLREPPLTLLQLPNLSWVALSDNPFLENLQIDDTTTPLKVIDDIDESVGEILGSGAGGITRRVEYKGQTVAVKTFNGAMTSDGLPAQERQIACAASALNCDSLIQVLGETPSGSLVMEYLDQYRPLAGPPSFDTCSRDVYPSGSRLNREEAERLVSGLLDALTKLHSASITHGDFYGHNILINENLFTSLSVKLSDFGAAFFYDRQSEYGKRLEAVELRAFAILVEEVHDLLNETDDALKELVSTCRSEKVCTFEQAQIWWKQKQLAVLAKAFDVDL